MPGGFILMDKKLYELMNDQVNKELYSAYAYFVVAEYYRSKCLFGFHSWFEKQAKEEMEHAEKFTEYLQDQGEKVELKSIEVLKEEFKDLRDPLLFQESHEAYVTSLIYGLLKRANEVEDFRAASFLDWFVSEQAEEEKNAKELTKKYDLFAKDGGLGLYKLDSELSKR